VPFNSAKQQIKSLQKEIY